MAPTEPALGGELGRGAGGGDREKMERMAMAVRSCVNLMRAAMPPCSNTAVRFSGQSLHAVRKHAAAYFLRRHPVCQYFCNMLNAVVQQVKSVQEVTHPFPQRGIRGRWLAGWYAADNLGSARSTGLVYEIAIRACKSKPRSHCSSLSVTYLACGEPVFTIVQRSLMPPASNSASLLDSLRWVACHRSCAAIACTQASVEINVACKSKWMYDVKAKAWISTLFGHYV